MKHRLFTAIDLPETSLPEVLALQIQLDKLRLPVIWEKHLHLTLNFLGSVADDQVGIIKNLVTKAVQPFTNFILQPLYLETLYSRHDPTILYLSLAKSEELTELQASLSSTLNEITPQPRRFLPHLTIGRLSRTDPVSTKRFMDIISDFPAPPFSEILVDKVILYKSLLSKPASIHQKIAQFMLESHPE